MWLTQQKADIIFLQETYSTKEVEYIWNTQYNGKRFYSHGTNHSCGVMILIKDDLEFEVKSAVSDSKGRLTQRYRELIFYWLIFTHRTRFKSNANSSAA